MVFNHDSVTGDGEIIVEYLEGAKRQSLSELFLELQQRFGLFFREDGKETILPKGVKVFSVDANGKVVLTRLKAIVRNKTIKKIVEVKTRIGQVKITNDHSLIGLSEGKLAPQKPENCQWVCVASKYPSFNGKMEVDLVENNLLSRRVQNQNGTLLLNNQIIQSKQLMDLELMCFFGMWIADGCYHKTKGGLGIHVSAYQDAACARIIDSVFKRFGSKGPTVIDDGVTATVQSATFYRLMHHLGFFGNSYSKRVPSWVFGMPKNLIASFLRGYFSGDGTVSKGDINATTFSDGLAQDLKTLLVFFGIRVYTRQEHKWGKIGHKLSINQSAEKAKFMGEIGFLQKEKNAKVTFSEREKSNSRIPLEPGLFQWIKKNVVTKQFKDELIRKQKWGTLTRPMFRRMAAECKDPKLKEFLLKIIDYSIEFEPNKNMETISEGVETVVFDIETDQGNFICNNIVLKNTDGISGGGIIGTALRREGKSFQPLGLKQLYPEELEKIQSLGKNFVFVDFGSGQYDWLKEQFGKRFVIIDHQPQNFALEQHFNPILFGYDAGHEVSAAGAAYYVAKAMSEKNADLGALAIVGAAGDIQDFEGSFEGLNLQILKEAQESGALLVENDLRLYGRISRPLHSFLAFATNPTLPELTGNEENCRSFLEELRIPLHDGTRWRTYAMLNMEEKKTLTTALLLHLQAHNVPEWKMRELIGPTYSMAKEPLDSPLRDAKEYGTLLNSCGRHARSDVALQIVLGDRGEHYQQALQLLQQHRRLLRDGISFMQEKGVEEMEEFYLFDAGQRIGETIIGIVAGMHYGSHYSEAAKPIVALSHNENGTVKASARATRALVLNGINLGIALREVAESLGSEAQGGGHPIAGGIQIQYAQKESFLKLLDEKLKEQKEKNAGQEMKPKENH